MTFGGARDIQIENNLFGRHTCQIEKRTVCRDDEDAGQSFFQFGASVLQATVILGLFDLPILRLTDQMEMTNNLFTLKPAFGK